MLTFMIIAIMLVIVCLLAGLVADTYDYNKIFSEDEMIHFWNRKEK